MNTITIVGRLTKDPEIKYLDSGKAVATLSLADNRKVKGEQATIFFDVSVWGQRAETAAEYLKKGQEIAVVGQLDPVVVKGERAYLKVTAHDFTLSLGGRGDGSGDRQPAAAGSSRASAPAEDGVPF